jgi:hypothetical protein
MKSTLIALAAGLTVGMMSATYAKLPPAPPKSDAETKAEADKAAAAKAKDAELLGKAQDKAVANYKKNRGVSMDVAKRKK